MLSRQISLQWRHNEQDGVSNHHRLDYLLNRLFRSRSKKTSKLRVTGLCVGNSPGPVNSPHKGPVTWKMFPFDDVIMHHFNGVQEMLVFVSWNIHDFSGYLLNFHWLATSLDLFFIMAEYLVGSRHRFHLISKLSIIWDQLVLIQLCSPLKLYFLINTLQLI